MKNFFRGINNCKCNALITLGLLPFAMTMAQDLNFTQFYEMPLLRNPGLSGVFKGDIRVQSIYRNQWQSVTVPYSTMGASAEVVFPLDDYGQAITIGTQLLHDVAGDAKLKRTHILPVIAFRTPINSSNTIFSGAIMGGVVSSNFNQAAIRWGDQYRGGSYDPGNPTQQILQKTSSNYVDIGGGISINSVIQDGMSGYVGVGLFHANKPRVAFNNDAIQLGRKWSFNAGITLNTSDYSRVNLFTDYIVQEAAKNNSNNEVVGKINVLMAGFFYTYDFDYYDVDQPLSISFGAIYRLNDAIAPACRLDLKKYSLGISYDVNVSQLSIASGARGGFELTLAFTGLFNARWQFTQHPQGCNVGFRGKDIIQGAERKMRRRYRQ